MREALLLLAMLALVQAPAFAGSSKATLKIGVTVVAACPPGSGKPCPPSAVQAPAAGLQSSASGEPIMILRDERARTVTVVY
jgi:hypothetical protein